MRRTVLALALSLAACVVLAPCGGIGPAGEGPAPVRLDDAPVGATFALERVADGFVRPTHVSGAPGDARGLWVVEQTGSVWRLAGKHRRRVLDLRGEISVGAERGLLGLAFDPDFESSRRLFVNYTDRDGNTRVAEHRLGRDGRARGAGRILLAVEQPEENHNGGGMQFGPDGRLYVGMGDGGGAFDPADSAQDPRKRLGKLIAADVDAPGRPGWEIVLSGLRNPWRFWFDPAMDEVWIGDVGQDAIEEVDRLQLELDEPAKNLGWPAFEGDDKIGDRELRGPGELVPPVATYTHERGCSVTGGFIYRGRAVPALSGRYVLGDFCSGTLWTVRGAPGGGVEDARTERAQAPQLAHLGADADGELVLTTGDGKVLRATAP